MCGWWRVEEDGEERRGHEKDRVKLLLYGIILLLRKIDGTSFHGIDQS